MTRILVLGGGPAGYVAAGRAAQLGAEVTVVEYREIGGTCLNRGCIPTKAMVAGAARLHEARADASFGVVTGEVRLDFGAFMTRKEAVTTAAARRRRAAAQGPQGERRGAARRTRRPGGHRPRRWHDAGGRRRHPGERVGAHAPAAVRLLRPARHDERRAAGDRPRAGESGHRRRRRDRLRVRLRLQAARLQGHRHRDAGPAAARRGQAHRPHAADGLQEGRHRGDGEGPRRDVRAGRRRRDAAPRRRPRGHGRRRARGGRARAGERRPGLRGGRRAARPWLRGHRRDDAHGGRGGLRGGRRGGPAAARALGLPSGRHRRRERRDRLAHPPATAASCRTACSAHRRWRAAA